MVAQCDSIERIAAVHDCTVGELMKMNRLSTRVVFPGQKLLVPCPIGENDASNVISENRLSASQVVVATESSDSNEESRTWRGPGMAVQVCGHVTAESGPLKTILEKNGVSQIHPEGIDLVVEEAENDCMKRFVKLKVKQITEMNGTVTGTLLVTPNALMFDPDVAHPFVVENGQDMYIMMARMEEVISVTVFKNVTVLGGTKENREVYDFVHRDSLVPRCSAVPAAKETLHKTSTISAGDILKNAGTQSSRVCFDDLDLELKRKGDHEVHVVHAEFCFNPRLINAEVNKLDKTARSSRRTYSDPSNGLKGGEMNKTFISGNDKKRQCFSQPPATVNNVLTGLTSNSLSKLKRTLSTHASTIRGSVTSGAERVTQSAVNGTKSVAHGVISQSKAVAGTLQSGIQTSVRVAASHAKTAVGAVAAVPQGIASMGSGLFYTARCPEATLLQDKALKSSKTRKEQALETLISLKEKAQQLREAGKNKHSFHASSVDEALTPAKMFSAAEKSTLVDSPYFMSVRLNKKEKGQFVVDTAIRPSSANIEDTNEQKQEFWFAMPRHKIDAIYHFLLQWDPEKCGSSTCITHPNESVDLQKASEPLEVHGFIVLDSEDSEKFAVSLWKSIKARNFLVDSETATIRSMRGRKGDSSLFSYHLVSHDSNELMLINV